MPRSLAAFGSENEDTIDSARLALRGHVRLRPLDPPQQEGNRNHHDDKNSVAKKHIDIDQERGLLLEQSGNQAQGLVRRVGDGSAFGDQIFGCPLQSMIPKSGNRFSEKDHAQTKS